MWFTPSTKVLSNRCLSGVLVYFKCENYPNRGAPVGSQTPSFRPQQRFVGGLGTVLGTRGEGSIILTGGSVRPFGLCPPSFLRVISRDRDPLSTRPRKRRVPGRSQMSGVIVSWVRRSTPVGLDGPCPSTRDGKGVLTSRRPVQEGFPTSPVGVTDVSVETSGTTLKTTAGVPRPRAGTSHSKGVVTGVSATTAVVGTTGSPFSGTFPSRVGETFKVRRVEDLENGLFPCFLFLLLTKVFVTLYHSTQVGPSINLDSDLDPRW